jgi:hypothetical protein
VSVTKILRLKKTSGGGEELYYIEVASGSVAETKVLDEASCSLTSDGKIVQVTIDPIKDAEAGLDRDAVLLEPV